MDLLVPSIKPHGTANLLLGNFAIVSAQATCDNLRLSYPIIEDLGVVPCLSSIFIHQMRWNSMQANPVEESTRWRRCLRWVWRVQIPFEDALGVVGKYY